ncbi:uncharacterized protein EI90DRAFT_3124678 [Cantharellus anzutake]|uniref:uncharacterized protein n=1 Tax=Cantharellus anzutake TaxID=1750568 RepID=UPI001906B68F|nr:uncharacterized protein EI90DRAFT_3124678 [Cantharellus anzutake]KAF8330200.1 hypothetical protein EI90DRAFT_3124678 [Cantharellus anzutake]
MAGRFVVSTQLNGVISSVVEGTVNIVWQNACTEWLYRYSILPALCVNGIIWLNIIEGSFDTEHFATFIRGLLQQMNEASLDFSPIEPSFGWVKSLAQHNEMLCWDMSIRDNADASLAVATRLHHYISAITPELATLWFRHCNYL